MSRLTVLLCLALLVLVSSCTTGKVQPNQSQLLDGAKAYFLGDSSMKEMPGKAMVWDTEQVLMAGRRKQANAGREVPYRDFLWLVGADGKIRWDLALDSLAVMDLAVLDSAHALALLGAPRAQDRNGRFQLWKLNRAGEIVQRTNHAAPEGMAAMRLTRLAPDHLLVTAWKQNADSTELVCGALHANGAGELVDGKWDYPAEKLVPLKDGFLARRERQIKGGGTVLTELARLRPDGTAVWRVAQPLDTVQAWIHGAAETADGGILLTGSREDLFDPIVAKFSADGKLLWTKRPTEMEGYELYSLAPWGEDRFLVAAQKSLAQGRVPSRKDWDCLAAFVIDGEGNVLDSDLLPAHWTMPVGGVQVAGERAFFTGAGGAVPEGMQQWDLALYVVDKTQATAER